MKSKRNYFNFANSSTSNHPFLLWSVQINDLNKSIPRHIVNIQNTSGKRGTSISIQRGRENQNILLLLSHFSCSDSVLPHPWDSPGKNTGVGCHFLLQCIKVKSESEVTQSCPMLRDPMDCSLPGSSIHGIFQARVLEWGAIAFSEPKHRGPLIKNDGSKQFWISPCSHKKLTGSWIVC